MRALIVLLPTLAILGVMIYYAGKSKAERALASKDDLLRKLHKKAELHVSTDLDNTFAVIVTDEIDTHYKRLERKKD